MEEVSYFKLRREGKFKSLRHYTEQTEKMCIDAIRHLPKSFMYVMDKTDKIIEEAFSLDPSLIMHLNHFEQTDRLCILAIDEAAKRRKAACALEKVWKNLKNRSDDVCLRYAKVLRGDLPDDFFNGKGEQFVIKLLMTNQGFTRDIPKDLLEMKSVANFMMNRNPYNLFWFENPEDWMIKAFIENASSPLMSFVNNPGSLSYRTFLKIREYESQVPYSIRKVNLSAFDDLILKIPLQQLYDVSFLFARTCHMIVAKYPFLSYKWTGKCFRLFLKDV